SRRGEDDVLVATGRADVGELPPARDVHVQVGGVRMLSADHALVDGDAGSVEELAALLKIEERVRHRLYLAVADDGAVGALRHLPLPRLVAVELRGHDPFPARDGEELVAESDQPARRHAK